MLHYIWGYGYELDFNTKNTSYDRCVVNNNFAKGVKGVLEMFPVIFDTGHGNSPFDPRGSRQISMQAWLLVSLPAGIKTKDKLQTLYLQVFFVSP